MNGNVNNHFKNHINSGHVSSGHINSHDNGGHVNGYKNGHVSSGHGNGSVGHVSNGNGQWWSFGNYTSGGGNQVISRISGDHIIVMSMVVLDISALVMIMSVVRSIIISIKVGSGQQ